MKRCPSCNRTYTDLSLQLCSGGRHPLIGCRPSIRWIGHTDRRTAPHERASANEIVRPDSPMRQAPHWSPHVQVRTQKKSSVIWWVLGGIAVVGIIGIGLIIMLLALSNIGANENTSNDNNNGRIVNRNSSTNTNSTPENSNQNVTPTPPSGLTDDFGVERWRTGNFPFGDIWYADDEYHMRAKEKMYLVMYAPGTDYNTENARVRVTARSVDGVSGFGLRLIVHGESSRTMRSRITRMWLSGSEPQYR